MPRFESPLGTTQTNPQAPFRSFEVSDDSQPQLPSQLKREAQETNMQHNLENIRAFQQRFSQPNVQEEGQPQYQEVRHVNGKPRLSEGARRRLEILLNMTYETRQVEIPQAGMFELRNLRGQETREAVMAASQFDGSVQAPFEIRRQLLARSLTLMAGVSFEQFVGSQELEMKLLVLDELPEALLHRLHGEYLELVKTVKDKYQPQTPEAVKEVMEDLKK